MQSTEAVAELTQRVRDLLEAENAGAQAVQEALQPTEATQPEQASPEAAQDGQQEGDGAARACAQPSSGAETDGTDDRGTDVHGTAGQGQRLEPREGDAADQSGASTDAKDSAATDSDSDSDSDSDTIADRASAAKQAKPDDASATPEATAAQL
ncbi:hypothetical protein U5801_29000, partial [Lamprobacter modestohalophilus]|uniref:hypothetical protein n=1 Tax=Lamprobacter modestohalophilus TaxID=1064514 RepID=UPI002ADEE6A5